MKEDQIVAVITSTPVYGSKSRLAAGVADGLFKKFCHQSQGTIESFASRVADMLHKAELNTQSAMLKTYVPEPGNGPNTKFDI